MKNPIFGFHHSINVKTLCILLALASLTHLKATTVSIFGTLTVRDDPPRRFLAFPRVDIPDIDLTPANPILLAKIRFDHEVALRMEDSASSPENYSLSYRIVNNTSQTASYRHAIGFLDEHGDILPSIGISQFGFPIERLPGQQVSGFATTANMVGDTPLVIYGMAMQFELLSGSSLTVDQINGITISQLDPGSAIVPEPTFPLLISISAFLCLRRRRGRSSLPDQED